MHTRSALRSSPAVFVVLLCARSALATDFYVGPPGMGSDSNDGSQAAPFATIQQGVMSAQPGDTIFLHGGSYSTPVTMVRSGTAGAFITLRNVPGELPILDGGASGGQGSGLSTAGNSFIRFMGIAARRWGSGGFDNDFNTPGSNVQYVDCIADDNGINGIAFYKAKGVLIQNNIVGHNGDEQPSWSSGVNLYNVTGTFQDNQVIGNVSFENIDICGGSPCQNGSTDGSGYILDFNSTGALFENNIGFRNGGSCIRITLSSGAHIVNNTCYNDNQNRANANPANPGEIFFSAQSDQQNGTIVDNIAVGGPNNAGNNGPAGTDNVFMNKTTSAPSFWSNPGAFDFELVNQPGSTVIDKGSAPDAPSSDIGFDPKCLTTTSQFPLVAQNPPPSFWTTFIDYTYIASIGGIPACFHPAVRPQGAGPDIGAYEFGGILVDAGAPATTGGSSGSSSGGSSGADAGPGAPATRDAGADATTGRSSSGSSGGSSGSGSGSLGSSSSSGSSGSSSGAGASSGGSGSSGSSTSSGSTGGARDSGAGAIVGSSSGAAGGSSGAQPASAGGSSGGADAGDQANADAMSGGGKGCGCGTAPTAPAHGAIAFGLGLVAVALRRRSPRRPRR